ARQATTGTDIRQISSRSLLRSKELPRGFGILILMHRPPCISPDLTVRETAAAWPACADVLSRYPRSRVNDRWSLQELGSFARDCGLAPQPFLRQLAAAACVPIGGGERGWWKRHGRPTDLRRHGGLPHARRRLGRNPAAADRLGRRLWHRVRRRGSRPWPGPALGLDGTVRDRRRESSVAAEHQATVSALGGICGSRVDYRWTAGVLCRSG